MIFIALIYLTLAAAGIWGLRRLQSRYLRILGYAIVSLVGVVLLGSYIVMAIGFSQNK
jgi:hypothetical protein